MIYKMKTAITFLQLLLYGSVISNTNSDLFKRNLPDKVIPSVNESVSKGIFWENVLPMDYNISIIQDVEPNIYYGEAIITINILTNIKEISFEIKNLAIFNVTLVEGDFLLLSPSTSIYNTETDIININFSTLIKPNIYILIIKFIGNDKFKKDNIVDFVTIIYKHCYSTADRSMYLSLNCNSFHTSIDNWLIFEALGLAPVMRSSSFVNINFNISIKYFKRHIHLPHAANAFKIKHGTVWISAEKYSVNQNQLIAITTPGLVYDSIVSKDVNIRMWFEETKRADLSYAWLYIKTFMKYIQDVLSCPSDSIVPLTKTKKVINHAVLSKFEKDNKENFQLSCGLILYREADISMTAIELKYDYLRQVNIKRLIARKIIYDFMGDVSYWFNKRLANYIAVFTVHEDPAMRSIFDIYIVQNQHESLNYDYVFQVFVNPDFEEDIILDDNAELYTYTVIHQYIRVPSILHMLQNVITPKVFLDGIVKYIKHCTPALPRDPHYLWNVIQTVVDEKFVENNLRVSELMDSALEQQSYPILKVIRENEWVNVSIENVIKVDDYIFPITYTTQLNVNFTTAFTDIIWLNRTYINSPKRLVKINDDSWVIINMQGYCRINYDESNWNKIAKYLDSEKYDRIPAVKRAQIIDDAFYFMITNQIDSAIFWKLITHLSQEINFVPWYPMIKALEYMSSIFQFTDENVELIKKRLLTILDEGFGNAKRHLENKVDFIMISMIEIARWSCLLGSSNCKKAAFMLQQMHFSSFINNKFSLDLMELVYCNAMKRFKQNNWDSIFSPSAHVFTNYTQSISAAHKTDTESIKDLYKYAACVENPNIIRKYLDNYVIKMNDGKINRNVSINILFHVMARHAKVDSILDKILENFRNITEIHEEANKVALFIYIINHIHSRKQLEKVYVFVKNNYEELLLYVETKMVKRAMEILEQMNFINKFLDNDSKNRR